MRAFIAIPISEPCQKMLSQMQQQLQASIADVVDAVDVRWASIPSIHLTLKFLGDIDPAIIPGMAESLRAASHTTGALTLRLSGLGSFPNRRNPRIVWCGIQGDTDALSYLQEIVEAACNKYGFPPEGRSFHPHLTLGRIKGNKNLKPLMDCISKSSDLECGLIADHYNIYKSVLKPQGAVYTVLETITLNNPG